jgi:hypothetical protein
MILSSKQPLIVLTVQRQTLMMDGTPSTGGSTTISMNSWAAWHQFFPAGTLIVESDLLLHTAEWTKDNHNTALTTFHLRSRYI